MGENEFLPARHGDRLGTATCQIPEERRMARHCRHCAGDCPGDCLFGDSGRCIHGWNGKRPRQFTWQLLLTRKWWHRVFWGIG